jgi:hypothetical protein
MENVEVKRVKLKLGTVTIELRNSENELPIAQLQRLSNGEWSVEGKCFPKHIRLMNWIDEWEKQNRER